jgi:hypothetical protein
MARLKLAQFKTDGKRWHLQDAPNGVNDVFGGELSRRSDHYLSIIQRTMILKELI